MSNQQPAAPQTAQGRGITGVLKTVIAVIFYGGLTIFLLGSIGHVAWFFHLYEPAGAGDWMDMLPSYGKAVALDLAVFFLAYIAATGEDADKVIVWTFTILLTSISLYANYIYAIWFSPEKQTAIWNINILWGLTTTGWLSPLIASSYPLFAIVFMYLIERVISRRAETAEEMRQRLETLKEKRELELQIKAVTKNDTKNAAMEAIDSGLDVIGHFTKRLNKKPEAATMSNATAAEEAASSDSNAQSEEKNTDNLEAASNGSHNTPEANHDKQASGTGTPETTNHMALSNGLTGRSFIPMEEAAKMLQIDLKTIQALRRKTTLKCHPANVNLITFASIRDYDNKRPPAKRTIHLEVSAAEEANAKKLMELANSEAGTDIDKLDLTLQILQDKPDITDEALAEQLSLKRPASARFWRLKAYEIIKVSQENTEEVER